MDLDVNYVRSQFPVFATSRNTEAFFENAGGSYACRQTITALTDFYINTKVQPYAQYPASALGGQAMDHSRRRWADALGVDFSEVQFGPSTSINTYVLANAVKATLKPGDEVVVTNQDHEANTGALRRAATEAGATIREWRIDPETGLLDPSDLADLVGDNTKVVSFPHCSNIVGQENDVKALTAIAHAVGARVIVDGVSYAPHGFPDVADLGPDVYLFSLYKTYSVHQGLMVVRRGLLDELPNQGHFFNEGLLTKRLTPAGPDHAQEAAAGGVLDYVEDLAVHHGVAGASLRDSVAAVGHLWQEAEDRLAQPLLAWLADHPEVRLIGPSRQSGPLHRAPTVAFLPLNQSASELATKLVGLGVQISSGNFYAYRVLEGLGIDPEQGVVRASLVHYTSADDVALLLASLDQALA
ncbi:MAG: aminotransferase class V-fold PLP-dependent enzyme [Acidimicrobiia bacterium]|nr:aminotransferase class V-fold PLP-dependent enzyme [Acidimicrobiia bacterium]MDH5422528.1 aminotransferase class V-fold PLP-dependent enzyme [Acidimicrobiia bacterium]MDH5504172.1 aminotransferase class V-fold PLP-dependent enzyme [Acidimicrobiia bacterium]